MKCPHFVDLVDVHVPMSISVQGGEGVPTCCRDLLSRDSSGHSSEIVRVIEAEEYFLHQLEAHPDRAVGLLHDDVTVEEAITGLKRLIAARRATP